MFLEWLIFAKATCWEVIQYYISKKHLAMKMTVDQNLWNIHVLEVSVIKVKNYPNITLVTTLLCENKNSTITHSLMVISTTRDKLISYSSSYWHHLLGACISLFSRPSALSSTCSYLCLLWVKTWTICTACWGSDFAIWACRVSKTCTLPAMAVNKWDSWKNSYMTKK